MNRKQEELLKQRRTAANEVTVQPLPVRKDNKVMDAQPEVKKKPMSPGKKALLVAFPLACLAGSVAVYTETHRSKTVIAETKPLEPGCVQDDDGDIVCIKGVPSSGEITSAGGSADDDDDDGNTYIIKDVPQPAPDQPKATGTGKAKGRKKK